MHDFHFFSPMPSKTFQFPFLKFKESFCFSWVALRERTSQFVFGQTIYIFDWLVPILLSNLPARNRSKDSAWEIALLKVCKHTLHAEKKLSLLTSELCQFLKRRHNCREEPEEREETSMVSLTYNLAVRRLWCAKTTAPDQFVQSMYKGLPWLIFYHILGILANHDAVWCLLFK